MNDRNPVAEAGQAYLDRVWDAEKYRDELKDQLGGGVDIGMLLESDIQPGQFIERAGGLAELLRIVTTITELEDALKEAEAEYIKARRFAEAVESAEMHADVEEARTNVESYIGRKHGEAADPTESSRSHELRGPAIDLSPDPGLASDEAVEPFRGRPIADNPQA